MSTKGTKKSKSRTLPVWFFGLLVVVGIGLIALIVSSLSPANPVDLYP